MGHGVSSVQVEDRYFLQKVKLGQGNFSTVWRAADRQSGELVAIKQLHKASLAEQSLANNDVERENAMMRACEHENLITLIDTFEDENSFYLALEYCGDGDLGDKIQERGARLLESEAASWIGQMCAAVEALHVKSICHRDIKPDNFMVTSRLPSESARSSNSPCTLKLSDFGLAVFVPRGRRLVDKCGTPAFMPPEVHLLPYRSRGYGLPADMWAVGISMYAVLCGGQYPFHDASGCLDEQQLVLNGVVDFSEDGLKGCMGYTCGFSEKARELCNSMIERDVGRRVTADKALQHPWLGMARLAGSDRDAVPSRASAGSDLDLDPVAWANIEDRSQPGSFTAVAKAQAAAFPKLQASSQRQRNDMLRGTIQEKEELPSSGQSDPLPTFPAPLENKELEDIPDSSSHPAVQNSILQGALQPIEPSRYNDSGAIPTDERLSSAEQEALLLRQRRELQRRFQRKLARLQSQVDRLGQQFELVRPGETSGSSCSRSQRLVEPLSLIEENRLLRAELEQSRAREAVVIRQKLRLQYRLVQLRKRRRGMLRIPGEGAPRLLQRARHRLFARKTGS